MEILLLVIFSLFCFCMSDFSYGVHNPNGVEAMKYSYLQFFKSMCKIEYNWNFYKQWSTDKHPYDRQALINYASGKNNATARAANGHLLLDFNHDGEIDNECPSGKAFHEHNGVGQYGEKKGNPFTIFWFDDNWLARYASHTYSMDLPYGLSDYKDSFIRWKILSGDNSYWKPYLGKYFDQIALDGMYYISESNWDMAVEKARQFLEYSEKAWNKEMQQWDYPKIESNYYFGLILILFSQLRDKYDDDYVYLDHYVSIRSHILSNQQKSKDGNLLSWLTDIYDMNSLMNIETTSCNVLGLGSRRKFIFESSILYNKSANVFLRTYNAVSAVCGLSLSGNVFASGPGLSINSGVVEFVLRLHDPPSGDVGELKIVDGVSKKVVGGVKLQGNEFNCDEWKSVLVNFSGGNTVDFVLNWFGNCNMDVAFVSIL